MPICRHFCERRDKKHIEIYYHFFFSRKVGGNWKQFQTMADEKDRNFRIYFYNKFGVSAVEEKKHIESLLKEERVDVEKLKFFLLRFPLPSVYRLDVWKVLLGTFIYLFFFVCVYGGGVHLAQKRKKEISFFKLLLHFMNGHQKQE